MHSQLENRIHYINSKVTIDYLKSLITLVKIINYNINLLVSLVIYNRSLA